MNLTVFLSTPPARRATIQLDFLECSFRFLSTPPARRATQAATDSAVLGLIFLSTPPARRATSLIEEKDLERLFLSTPPARRATVFEGWGYDAEAISIHAPREEGD